MAACGAQKQRPPSAMRIEQARKANARPHLSCGSGRTRAATTQNSVSATKLEAPEAWPVVVLNPSDRNAGRHATPPQYAHLKIVSLVQRACRPFGLRCPTVS